MADDDPNRPGPDGHPILFTVIEMRDRAQVRALIAAGADIEALGFARATPVVIAALGSNWRIVEVLLQAGANPLAADEQGFTVPYLAANSRLRPETEEGQALDRVRAMLNERGVIGVVVHPDKVEQMLEEGRWPPPPEPAPQP